MHTPAPQKAEKGGQKGKRKDGPECIRLHCYIETLPVCSLGLAPKKGCLTSQDGFLDDPVFRAEFARAERAVESALPYILLLNGNRRAGLDALVANIAGGNGRALLDLVSEFSDNWRSVRETSFRAE